MGKIGGNRRAQKTTFKFRGSDQRTFLYPRGRCRKLAKNKMIMACHSLNNNTRTGLVIYLCLNRNHFINLIPSPRITSNFRQLWYYRTYFLNCIKEWNQLDVSIRSSRAIFELKRKLIQLLKPKRQSYSGVHDIEGIRYVTPMSSKVQRSM